MKPFFTLREFQLKEFSKYWFDLSKLTIASLILKFFEPGSPKISIGSVLILFVGLTCALFFVIVGLKVGKGVKR